MNSALRSCLWKIRFVHAPAATHNYFTSSVRLNNNETKVGPSHRVDKLEKKFLVWTGKYKTAAEVPDFVTPDVMERARNRMRIKIANLMMLATALACFAMVMIGRQKRDRGESVEKMNLEWHRRINEEEAQKAAK